MKTILNILTTLFLLTIITSCKKGDDTPTINNESVKGNWHVDKAVIYNADGTDTTNIGSNARETPLPIGGIDTLISKYYNFLPLEDSCIITTKYIMEGTTAVEKTEDIKIAYTISNTKLSFSNPNFPTVTIQKITDQDMQWSFVRFPNDPINKKTIVYYLTKRPAP